MEAEAELGFTTATDLAEYLVEKGVPFREAHSIVGRIVAYCLDAGKELAMITFEELKKFHAVFADDVLPRLKAARSVNMKKTFGGTSPERVAERIREIEQGE